MQRLRPLILIVLLCLGCGAIGKPSEPGKVLFDKYGSRQAFLRAIERGDADADAFVEAIKRGPLRFSDVSPQALANYLEAFANEGMLRLIPLYFFEDEEMITSLDTVFEDPENTSSNWEVYKDHLGRVHI